MIKKQVQPLFTLIKWIAEKYVELEKKTLPYAFKLINITEKNNKKIANIQIAGQLDEVGIELEKMMESNIFEYFSAADKKKLFFSLYKNEKFQISDHYFCIHTKKEMIVLSDILSQHRKTLTAAEISTDNQLINQLSSKDANKIGFLTGMEYVKDCRSVLVE